MSAYPPSAFHVLQGPGLPYLYPPLFLPLVAPLLALPLDLVHLLWSGVMATAAALTVRRLGVGWPAAAAVLLWPPFFEGIWVGNIQVVLFGAFVWAMTTGRGSSGHPSFDAGCARHAPVDDRDVVFVELQLIDGIVATLHGIDLIALVLEPQDEDFAKSDVVFSDQDAHRSVTRDQGDSVPSIIVPLVHSRRVRSVALRFDYARCTWGPTAPATPTALWSASFMIDFDASIGTANAMPTPPVSVAVSIPMTKPDASSSGPPLLPGLMAASIRMSLDRSSE